MNYQAFSNSKLDKAMTTEQFNQIVEAILAGKYSWACVLILRFAGYNPLHYIPYRTYNRLIKENKSSNACAKNSISQNCSTKITDLSYSETLEEECSKVRGGYRSLGAINISLNLTDWNRN